MYKALCLKAHLSFSIAQPSIGLTFEVSYTNFWRAWPLHLEYNTLTFGQPRPHFLIAFPVFSESLSLTLQEPHMYILSSKQLDNIFVFSNVSVWLSKCECMAIQFWVWGSQKMSVMELKKLGMALQKWVYDSTYWKWGRGPKKKPDFIGQIIDLLKQLKLIWNP